MATIRKKGELQWHVQVRRKHVNETKTFTTKMDADSWAREVENQIDRGVYISRVEAESISLGEACDRYEREVLPRLKGKASDTSRLKTIKFNLGNLPLAAISSTILAKFRDERLKVVGKQSVIHELGLITRILKCCTLDWGIGLPSGVPAVRKPNAPEGRSRRVEQSEIDAIMAVSDSVELPEIMQLVLETTMRRGEIYKIKWEHVDFKKPIIRLENTKNDLSREVPLSSRAVAVLKALPRRIDGRVFSLRPDSITQAFDRALLRARAKYESDCELKNIKPEKNFLVGIHFHDLRHEATSRIALKVSNLIELASITGHQDLQMLKRYYHPKAEDLAKKLG